MRPTWLETTHPENPDARDILTRVHDNWPQQTDSEPTDRKQRRLAENCDPKYIFTIPRPILPKPSLCDEMTATKSCNEIVASRSVCLQSVCRGQLTWLVLTLGTSWRQTLKTFALRFVSFFSPFRTMLFFLNTINVWLWWCKYIKFR